MPETVPTMAEYEALCERVDALEAGSSAPPDIIPPTTGTPRTRLIAYLNGLAGHQCLLGQTSFPDQREFNEVTAAFGFSPALMVNDPWLVQWSGNAPFSDAFVPSQIAHAKAGGIAGLSLMLPNPLTGNTSTSSGIDLTQAATPGNATNAGLNRLLDQGVGVLNQFKAADIAVPVRYMFELDGAWFWWGMDRGGPRTNQQQTRLFRYITDYLRGKGLGDTILPTFAINGGPGTYQYPGDDWVDIVGIDAYTDTLASTYGHVYDALHSQAPGKVFGLTEYGTGDPNGCNPAYDMNRLKPDIQAALPRATYCNFWSGWQPNKCRNGKAAMSDPYWINKSQVQL